jgi:glyoxylase-like metal-dependent hydrolase (beta-lactamase superfamily II)
MRVRKFLILLLLSLAGLRSGAQALKISKIAADVYVFTTYQTYGGSLFPSNSMYVVTDEGVVLIDTPWDTTQILPLMDSLQVRHNKKVIACISTHFHDDRVGGVDFLNALGIKTYASSHTVALCKKKTVNVPAFSFVNDTSFSFGRHKIQTYFPGHGHTEDNIVIWVENERVLFGGCLVKSLESEGLGNIADADLSKWPASIDNVITKFPQRAVVIPGHQSWQDLRSLEFTLKLLKEHKSN